MNERNIRIKHTTHGTKCDSTNGFQKGSSVDAGTLVVNGHVVIEATKVHSDSAVSRSEHLDMHI